jgi:hypothetical protein
MTFREKIDVKKTCKRRDPMDRCITSMVAGLRGLRVRLYQRLRRSFGTAKEKEEREILAYIKTAHSEVEQADSLFNEMTDAAAVDYAAYQLLAAKARYAYLIQLAKERGLSA